MSDELTSEQRAFLERHMWGVLASARASGAPHQSMVGYTTDADGRIVISTKAFTVKWRNVVRNPHVSFTVVDGRAHLVVDGEAETIDDEPERAALSADVFAALAGSERPDPASIVATLDEQQRTIIRITPRRATFHE